MKGLDFPTGEAERAGAAQSGEEKAQGDVTHVYKDLTGGSGEKEPTSSEQRVPHEGTRDNENKART